MLVANPKEFLMGVESEGPNVGLNILQVSKLVYLGRGKMNLIDLRN